MQLIHGLDSSLLDLAGQVACEERNRGHRMRPYWGFESCVHAVRVLHSWYLAQASLSGRAVSALKRIGGHYGCRRYCHGVVPCVWDEDGHLLFQPYCAGLGPLLVGLKGPVQGKTVNLVPVVHPLQSLASSQQDFDVVCTESGRG